MLNLSDKELDRLSREAADRHDPGDLVGPQSWERLELRLDKELGRIGPSPLQGIRRIPFYYAPVIILLVGVSYYFIRQGKSNTAKTEPSGSPPMTVVKPLSPVPNSTDLSTKTSENSDNSTPPHTSETSAQPNASAHPEAGTGPDHQAPDPASNASPGSTSVSQESAVRSTSPGMKPALTPGKGPALARETGSAPTRGSGSAQTKSHHAGLTSPGSTGADGSTNLPGSTDAARSTGAAGAGATGSRAGAPGSKGSPELAGSAGSADSGGSIALPGTNRPSGNGTSTNPSSGYTRGSVGSPGSITPPREPEFSRIQDARSLARHRGVDDSALKAAAVSGVAGPIRLDKKSPGLRISRPLQFGFSLSPDFASVHSLAGDRPGSSIGLTMDYQFADRLYLSTGLLLTRKNYASSPQDYHVPDNYYRINNIHDVSLIKGSFYMLEIPLNLRYDFLLTGNTVFFLSGGASSYLLTSEHSQYYFNLFGTQTCQNFKGEEARRKNYLFSAVNLSMGVETGLSNSLSLLIAPYVKVPTAGMGFGQVQITSVGLNFALKYAPVLSRKRQH